MRETTMKLGEWNELIIGQHIINFEDKVEQFGLIPLIQDGLKTPGFNENLEQLQQLGIWALQNPTRILKAIHNPDRFCVLVGFRPSRFHLGHVTLARELTWYISRGAIPFFIVSGYEANTSLTIHEAKKKVMEFWQIVIANHGQDIPEPTHVYSDKECLDLRLMEDHVGECVPVQKVLQLYGWESSISVAALRVATMNAAAFLFPSRVLQGAPTLVLSDVKQMTHAEIAKIAARRLNIAPPAFSYRMLLPSLLGPQQRMSVKDERSAIFLDENAKAISNKLLKCFSGGRKTVAEQHEKGGDPLICSFFRNCSILFSPEDVTQMLNKCVSGQNLCGQCKSEYIEPCVAGLMRLTDR